MNKRQDHSDKRQFGRRPINLSATARVPGHAPVPCLLGNVSDGGALIYLDHALPMPQSFRLTSEDGAIDQIVEVRYQLARLLGLEFIAPAMSDAQVKLIAERAYEFDAWLDLTMR